MQAGGGGGAATLVVVTSRPAQWIAGGEAKYRIELDKFEEHMLSGIYQGRFEDEQVKVRVQGTDGRPLLPPVNQAQVVATGRPRLLFTAEDISDLRRASFPQRSWSSACMDHHRLLPPNLASAIARKRMPADAPPPPPSLAGRRTNASTG